jgi:hypothetical protein
MAWHVMVPEHREIGRRELGPRGQVDPDLKQLEAIARIGLEQRKHFRVHDAGAGREPLYVAAAEARSRAERVAVVDEALAHVSHGLEAAMRMLREAGHDVAVIHAPAVLAGEVLADVAAFERRRRPQAVVAARVEIDVVDANEERILGLPRKGQRGDAHDRLLAHAPSLPHTLELTPEQRARYDAATDRSSPSGGVMSAQRAPSPAELEHIRDYAWSWFSYHAEQRTSMFNYSLAAAALLAAGYGAVFDKSIVVAAAIGFVGAVVMVCFVFLDFRNRRLVEHGETALMYVESALFKRGNAENMPVGILVADLSGIDPETAQRELGLDATKKPSGLGTHKVLLPLVEIIVCIAFLAGGIAPFAFPTLFQQ